MNTQNTTTSSTAQGPEPGKPGATALRAQIVDPRQSALRKYQDVIVGSTSLWYTIKFELILWLGGALPGALGLLARKLLYPRIFKRVGRGTVFGAGLVIRHPNKIEIGANVVISDRCWLDARGQGNSGIRIGDDSILGDGVMLRTKRGSITLGRSVGIGPLASLDAVDNDLVVGDSAMIGPRSQVGGSQYHTTRLDIPIQDQGKEIRPGVRIGSGGWIGTGVMIVDGVTIGDGCLVGAGAIVREDIPDYTSATPHQRLVMIKRGGEGSPGN